MPLFLDWSVIAEVLDGGIALSERDEIGYRAIIARLKLCIQALLRYVLLLRGIVCVCELVYDFATAVIEID